MLATILLKHFPISPVPLNDFIKIMRLVQTESGASSEAVCEVVTAAVKGASQVEATKAAWIALLEHVKPKVLNVPLAEQNVPLAEQNVPLAEQNVPLAAPGIFSRVWTAVFGPAQKKVVLAEVATSPADVMVPEKEPVSKETSVPEEKPVVPEPEIHLQPIVQAPEQIAVADKCEVPQVSSNQDAFPKVAGVQKKKKNHGHK